MIYGNTVGGSGGSGIGKTLIIEDEAGNELVGVVVGKNVIFDATANDIRAGKVAATQNGVTTGEKEIPSYNTTEGYKVITNGSKFLITIPDFDYTKLQAVICSFNTDLINSVSTEKVVINDNVYPVQNATAESTVIVDKENQRIDLGITNTSGAIAILRYFSYKEIY